MEQNIAEQNDVGVTKKGKKSPVKVAWQIISTVFVVLVCVVAVLLAGVRIVGLTPFAVLSPSMTPTYGVGSLVYVEQVEASSIRVGDPITFVAGTNNTVVTHRAVRIDSAEGCIYTKGDANEAEDASPVYFENVVGRVVFSIPYLGYLSMALSTTSGRFACIACVLFLVVLLLIPEVIKAFKKEEKSAKE